MGTTYDLLRIAYPLPDPEHNELEFQTKGLWQDHDTYLITPGGRLILVAHWLNTRGERPHIDMLYCGALGVYTLTAAHVYVRYSLIFTDGRISRVDGPQVQDLSDRAASLYYRGDAET